MTFLNFLINGISLGSIYAIIALGTRTLAVEVLQVAETVKKDDASAMYKEV